MVKWRCNIDENEIASLLSQTEEKNHPAGPEEQQQRNVAGKRSIWLACVRYKPDSRWSSGLSEFYTGSFRDVSEWLDSNLNMTSEHVFSKRTSHFFMFFLSPLVPVENPIMADVD